MRTRRSRRPAPNTAASLPACRGRERLACFVHPRLRFRTCRAAELGNHHRTPRRGAAAPPCRICFETRARAREARVVAGRGCRAHRSESRQHCCLRSRMADDRPPHRRSIAGGPPSRYPARSTFRDHSDRDASCSRSSSPAPASERHRGAPLRPGRCRRCHTCRG